MLHGQMGKEVRARSQTGNTSEGCDVLRAAEVERVEEDLYMGTADRVNDLGGMVGGDDVITGVVDQDVERFEH